MAATFAAFVAVVAALCAMPTAAEASDSYREHLLLTPLSDGDVAADFSFDITFAADASNRSLCEYEQRGVETTRCGEKMVVNCVVRLSSRGHPDAHPHARTHACTLPQSDILTCSRGRLAKWSRPLECKNCMQR